MYHGDDWALVRAIERGDAGAALRELAAALDHGGVPFQILGQLGYAVRTPPPRGRFPARRVPAAVDALFRTDIAHEVVGRRPKVLLERLIVELSAGSSDEFRPPKASWTTRLTSRDL